MLIQIRNASADVSIKEELEGDVMQWVKCHLEFFFTN